MTSKAKRKKAKPAKKAPAAPPAAPDRLADAPQAVLDAYQRLTPIRRRFAMALPGAASAEAAAREAGYAEKTVRAKAASMAAEPAIKAVVDYCTSQAIQSGVLNVRRLLKEIEMIALADPRELLDPNTNELLPSSEWPEHAARALAGIETTAFKDGGSSQTPKFWPKLDALKEAAKLLGAYPEKKDKAPSQMIVGVVVVPQKGGYQHPERPAITGEATRVQRTEPLKPKAKAFKVKAAR